MHSLDAITASCHHGIVDEDEGLDLQFTYAQKADPQSVLELVTIAGGQKSLPLVTMCRR